MKRRISGGFTFIEIIIACFILALAVVTIYYIVTPGIKATKKGSDIITDLTNLNIILDMLKKDIRTCMRFGKNAGSTMESYSFTVIQKVTPAGIEKCNVNYTISPKEIWRTEIDYTTGKKLKTRLFCFAGSIKLTMEKDTTIKNMIYISELGLKDLTDKITIFNLKTNALSGLVERVNLKSFYPEIELFP